MTTFLKRTLKILILSFFVLLFTSKLCFADVYMPRTVTSIEDLNIIELISWILVALILIITFIAAIKIVMANLTDDISYEYLKEKYASIIFYACLFFQSYFYIIKQLTLGSILFFFVPAIIATALRILAKEKKVSMVIMILSTIFTVLFLFLSMGVD